MRVAEYLRDRQHAARLKGTMTLAQGSSTIWNLSEGRAVCGRNSTETRRIARSRPNLQTDHIERVHIQAGVG